MSQLIFTSRDQQEERADCRLLIYGEDWPGELLLLSKKILWWSTRPLAFGCLLFDHVIYLKLKKKWLYAKLRKFTDMTIFFTLNGPKLPLWVKIVVILWFCSAWDKSLDTYRSQLKYTRTHVDHLRPMLRKNGLVL